MSAVKNLKKSQAIQMREDCYGVFEGAKKNDIEKLKKLDTNLLLRMYRNMVMSRALDERGMKLQRQGRIGFYVPSFGQEAISTAIAAALEDEDWIYPSYREPGLFLYRGCSLYHMMGNLFGNQADLCQGRQMPNHYAFAEQRLFSVSSPISTQVIQAVGHSMADKIHGNDRVVATFFGDGGTSENDFHTGMTFAGAQKTPVLFVCTNNQYAISVPLEKQSGTERLAQKAQGYGIEGEAVDGNDVLAIYLTAKKAIKAMRKEKKAFFIECVSFRMGPHSSSDDPTRYQDPDKVAFWKERDPIKRFYQYLEAENLWDKTQDEELWAEVEDEVMEAVERAEKAEAPPIQSLFDQVFETQTPQLAEQQAQLEEESRLRTEFKNTSVNFPL